MNTSILSLLENLQFKRIGFWREFAIALAVCLAARASILFPLNYAEDTYTFLAFPEANNFSLWTKEMRIFHYFFHKTVEFFGANYPCAGGFWPILFSAALVFAGLASMRIWVPTAGSAAMVIGAVMVALFPYQTEFLIFHNNGAIFTFGLVAGWLGLYVCDKGRWWGVAGLIGIVLCVWLQITFVYLFTVIFIEALIWLFRRAVRGRWFGREFLESARPWATRLLVLISGTVIYVLITKAALSFLDLPTGGRIQFSGLSEYPDKVLLFLKQSYFFLFVTEVSQPISIKILQLGFFIVTLAAGVGILIRRGAGKISLALIWCALLAVSIVAVGICMGITLPMKNAYDFMIPRTLSSLAFYWAGIFALSLAVSNSRSSRLVCLSLGALLAFGYAVNSNRQAVDHARINSRDRLAASRIVERFSQLPGFEGIRTVVVCATDHRFNLDNVSTETQGFNVSALSRPWSSTAVLRETSGWKIQDSGPEDRAKAQQAAIGKPVWPQPGSVFIVGDIGVVAMPK